MRWLKPQYSFRDLTIFNATNNHFFALAEQFVLIYWPKEESVSVIKREDVLTPANPSVGSVCELKVSNRTYQGKLAAVGKYAVQVM